MTNPLSDLEKRVAMACDWLVDVAQVKTDQLTLGEDTLGKHYDSWKGAIRGEYWAATKQWGFFCPIWHTGQAVNALTMASDTLGSSKYPRAAEAAVAFILDKQIWQEGHPDHGLILAYEDLPAEVNTSAILECLSGMISFAEKKNSPELLNRMAAAADFVIDRLYMPREGLFRDRYDPKMREIIMPSLCPTKDNKGGRPLNDGGCLAYLYRKTGRRKFLDVHIRVSETLVADQNPPGNWIDYGPCNAAEGLFHPRTTYWYALPLLDSYRLTGRKEFLDTAIASGEFCRRAMRSDGGWIRGLYQDPRTGVLNTECFGHATSGSACAAILFVELCRVTKDPSWLKDAEKALTFCCNVQFTRAEDPNLQGAILEKVMPPDGTDRSPYHLRDLGTIFFVIAALEYLKTRPKT